MNIDPLTELMPDQSPYNYAFNNPVFWIDPDGRMPEEGDAGGGSVGGFTNSTDSYGRDLSSSSHIDSAPVGSEFKGESGLSIKGDSQKEALDHLQSKSDLKLSMNDAGKVDCEGEANTEADKLLKSIIKGKKNIHIIIQTVSKSFDNGEFISGKFMGNVITNSNIIAKQVVNPTILARMEDIMEVDRGSIILHEIFEAYFGAIYHRGVDFASVGFRQAYEDSHDRANILTPELVRFDDVRFEYLAARRPNGNFDVTMQLYYKNKFKGNLGRFKNVYLKNNMKSINILLSVFMLCCTISMHSQTMESEYIEKTKLEFDYFYSLQLFNFEYEYLHLNDSIEKNNFIAKKIIYDSQLIFDFIVDKIESDGFYSRKYSNSVFKNEANDLINILFYTFVRDVYKKNRFFNHLDNTEDKRKLIIESIITRNENNMIEPCEFNHLMYVLTKHDKYWEYLENNGHVIRLTSSTSFVKAEPLVLCY